MREKVKKKLDENERIRMGVSNGPRLLPNRGANFMLINSVDS
jgi:hypothetical protein